MIKFLASLKDSDKKMLGIGLSFENLKRLKDGTPLNFSLSAMGVDPSQIGEVFIFAGEDETTIVEHLIKRGLLDSNTTIHPTPGDVVQ